MGLGHSPRIVTNGLVFAYDMSNFQKSWRGAPTTNLLQNPLPAGNTTGYTASGGTGTLTYDSANEAIKWVRTAYEAWGAFHTVDPIFNGNLNTGLQYTISFEWKTENTAVANSAYTYNLVQGNGVSAAASANLLSNSVLLPNGWYLFKYTFFPLNTGINAYNRIILGSQSINVSTFYWRKLQFEQAGFATPFVNGTRSNTQAILDLTNNNTVTVPSLTYASDGTFSFNGSGDRITSSSSIFNRTNGQELTVSCWIKPSRLSGQYSVFCTNRSIDAGTFNWIFYQHTNDGAISFHGSAQNKSTYIPTVGAWINVTNTVTSSGVSTLYVNGVSTFVVNGFTYGGTPSLLGIGANPGAQEPFQGSISNVKIYNRALTAQEVAQNFNALRGRFGI